MGLPSALDTGPFPLSVARTDHAATGASCGAHASAGSAASALIHRAPPSSSSCWRPTWLRPVAACRTLPSNFAACAARVFRCTHGNMKARAHASPDKWDPDSAALRLSTWRSRPMRPCGGVRRSRAGSRSVRNRDASCTAVRHGSRARRRRRTRLRCTARADDAGRRAPSYAAPPSGWWFIGIALRKAWIAAANQAARAWRTRLFPGPGPGGGRTVGVAGDSLGNDRISRRTGV